ncbi:(2Fe-2S)-binding protein [Seonamhaeicola marinus]|uniref:(2Fe-2S)-binding protein n=1 Tax=Seonamhaeicola marinus TaxID=1912246 RepID=A0A5D0I700_9FLAO|nr:(2Fe-2S)-binding protein [Seonamhaeicola marinus]TYA78719.1 (2Fe-2S)-binding protein [Seonamhaeicola marinus]
MNSYNIKINGKEYTIDAVPNMPLLWVIRDIMDLTGTKYGCGSGFCGACTIHLDGKPTRSCITTISTVENKEILTIEGLTLNGFTALQQAWLEEEVPQCGYCQSGQIMSAQAFLNDNPSPSKEAIISHMAGNICRCGTYPRIVKAILKASKMNQSK